LSHNDLAVLKGNAKEVGVMERTKNVQGDCRDEPVCAPKRTDTRIKGRIHRSLSLLAINYFRKFLTNKSKNISAPRLEFSADFVCC